MSGSNVRSRALSGKSRKRFGTKQLYVITLNLPGPMILFINQLVVEGFFASRSEAVRSFLASGLERFKDVWCQNIAEVPSIPNIVKQATIKLPPVGERITWADLQTRAQQTCPIEETEGI
jgi:Arc/MetJ-type ribon-helix-helix transcriptional regulator